MTEIKAAAPKPEHAHDLQAKLYREIGISAVAAALRFTTQAEPASRPRGLDKLPETPHLVVTRAA